MVREVGAKDQLLVVVVVEGVEVGWNLHPRTLWPAEESRRKVWLMKAELVAREEDEPVSKFGEDEQGFEAGPGGVRGLEAVAVVVLAASLSLKLVESLLG